MTQAIVVKSAKKWIQPHIAFRGPSICCANVVCIEGRSLPVFLNGLHNICDDECTGVQLCIPSYLEVYAFLIPWEDGSTRLAWYVRLSLYIIIYYVGIILIPSEDGSAKDSGCVQSRLGAERQLATAYVGSPPSPISATKSNQIDFLSAKCSNVKPSPSFGGWAPFPGGAGAVAACNK